MDNPHRLPRTVTPSRYALRLTPDLEACTFAGVADISVTIHDRTDVVVLNADELVFGSGWLETPAGRIDIKEVEVEPEFQRWSMLLDRAAETGEATLHIEFDGELNDKLRGFYRSTYTDESGTVHTVGTTQMQPVSARYAFPCWDEPDLKAVFSITLVVPDGMMAISNAPEVGREPVGDGQVAVRFDDTMVMSTYLLAFMVGRMDATEAVDVDGIPLRVVHVPGKGNLAPFALEVGAAALRFFNDYYGIAYPEQKLDMLALPDFAAGAMENPGCITYREVALLVDPATATQTELMRIADVVAHEIAHMWFGDLVTMRWWNGIWLNEAFATFMALLAVDAYKPEWERFTSFCRYRTEAFEVDGLLSTRPIEYEVIAPSDIDDMFDVLTYEKGAAVLWMMEQHLGPERFRDGIRHYLREHLYGNTETSDLWDALEETTGEPVRRVMDAWIWQGGHPMITLSRSGDVLTLEQGRFTYAGTDDGTRWPTPYRVRLGASKEAATERLLVEAEGASLPVPAATGSIVGNADATGFVRTRYSGDLFATVVENLGALSARERYSLVDDTWATVLAGSVSADDFLMLAERYVDEQDNATWQAVLEGLGSLSRLVDGEALDAYRAYVRDLVAPAAERAGWEPREGETDLQRELRGTLLRAMGIVGRDPATIERAVEVEKAVRAGETVDGPVGAAAVPIAAVAGGQDEHAAYLRMYTEGRSPQEQRRYLGALALFPQPELAGEARSAALTGQVRSQDRPWIVDSLLSSRDHGDATWDWIKDNFDAVMDGLTPHLQLFMVEGVHTLDTQAAVEDVAAFFETHPLVGVEMMLSHHLEIQRVRAALREREAERLATRFGG